MPYGGGNNRAIEARERKAAVKAERIRAQKEHQENLRWKDEVSESIVSKKELQVEKQQEKLRKKKEKQQLEEAEDAEFNSHKQRKEGPPKVTRAQIQERALLAAIAKKKEEEAAQSTAERSIFEMENPNRWRAEEEAAAKELGQEYISASSPAEFLEMMSATDSIDRFVTKRMKASYTAYEEEWLEKFKQENSKLKRSQMKEKIWKQWQKAPENPMNQQVIREA